MEEIVIWFSGMPLPTREVFTRGTAYDSERYASASAGASYETPARQITRSDLIRLRAEPVTVIAWSPRLPFTKNQPPIVVATTTPTDTTTAESSVADRPSAIERGTPLQTKRIENRVGQYTLRAALAIET